MSTAAPTPPSEPAPSKQPPPRRFRLQISLRMLLLLMAAVGVTLAVYRWPWEETKQQSVGTEFFPGEIADFVTKSTYHRSWRGSPVLHGQQTLHRRNQLRHECNFYDGELHGPRRMYDHRGLLLWEAHYRNGKLHGPFRAGDGEHWYWSGHYWNDLPHGEWEFITYRATPQGAQPPQINDFQKSYLFYADNAAIIARRKAQDGDRLFFRQRQAWQRGKRQGVWKWETLDGELINTAVYEDNNFVRWNGAPVVEQFWEWLQTAPLHADTKSLLYASRDIAAVHEFTVYDELSFRLTDEQAAPQSLVVYAEPSKQSVFPVQQGERSLVPMLCEQVCANGYAFDCRFGTLWLVPHVDPAPLFVDGTGVAQIQFPAGSPQARDWLAEVQFQESFEYPTVQITNLLFGSSLQSESNIRREDELFDQQNYFRQMLLSRYANRRNQARSVQRISRRDAIGLILLRAGYRCELQGADRIVLISDRTEVPPRAPFRGF